MGRVLTQDGMSMRLTTDEDVFGFKRRAREHAYMKGRNLVLNPSAGVGQPTYVLMRPSDPWLSALVEMLEEGLITCDDYDLLEKGS